MKYKGLTYSEIREKKSIGLTNTTIDSYSASYTKIIFRNIFNLVNIVLFPMLIVLATFQLYVEILAFTTFLTINTIVSILDEVRAKSKLDKLKSEFQQTARVVREGREENIPVSEIVEGDYVLGKEGEGIIADGEVLEENYLQMDESMLTGESNYIEKDPGDKVLSGSFIVTGNCVYKIEKVGKSNYLNKLGSEAFLYKKKQSSLQEDGNKLITFLVICGFLVAALNFIVTGVTGVEVTKRILSLTAIIALIIPQTLIFLFTLTFTISITKLFNKGILIQKGGSIEELANIDTICFDKTGTLTTNKMKIIKTRVFNLNLKDFGKFYNSVSRQIISVNETQKLINEFFGEYPQQEIVEFNQIPFTSKNKYSLVSAKFNDEYTSIIFGAISVLKQNISDEVLLELGKYIEKEEEEGNRLLVGILFNSKDEIVDNFKESKILPQKTDKVIVFTIEEELNPGIGQLLNDLKTQGIEVKIISGDSKVSVSRIATKIGFKSSEIVDLSEIESKKIEELADSVKIFTRAVPEDKLKLIIALKNNGRKVAMVGDGINDVLGLKASDVSIAMESGSKITREISDIVLLNNDYKKIPGIFFEGENIIFNLKLSTKMFLVKSFMAILFGIIISILGRALPLHPTSTLIFSFLGSSAPSYLIIFTRQNIKKQRDFFKEVLFSSIPTSIIFTALISLLYFHFYNIGKPSVEINTALVLFALVFSIFYSLFLIREAGKLKNILVAVFSFLILITIGLYQTILPVYQDKYLPFHQILLLSIMILAGFLVYIFAFKILSPKNKLVKIVLFPLSIIVMLGLSIFPSQTYYQVTQLSINYFLLILGTGIIGLFAITVGHFILNLLYKNVRTNS